MKSKAEIEEELQNVIKDMENTISEGDEFIAHLASRRDALEWILGE